MYFRFSKLIYDAIFVKIFLKNHRSRCTKQGYYSVRTVFQNIFLFKSQRGYRTSPNIKTPVTRLFTAGLALNVWRMWSLFFCYILPLKTDLNASMLLINCPRQCHGKRQLLRQYHCLSDKKKRKILRICLVSAEFSGPSFQFSWLKTFFRWISLISLCFLSVFLSLFCFLRIFCQFVLWAISLHFNIIIYVSVNQGLNSKDLRANGFSDGLW